MISLNLPDSGAGAKDRRGEGQDSPTRKCLRHGSWRDFQRSQARRRADELDGAGAIIFLALLAFFSSLPLP
jgi:hypothetical protein